MEKLTWKQIEEYLRSRKDVIIPIGSTEEHGYHLPLSTDTIIAQEFALELGRRLGILTAPVISYGVCRHTAPYPGTTGVEFDSLREFVGSILKDFHGKGFEVFYLLTGHAGTTHIVALKEVGRGLIAKGAEVHLIVPLEFPIEDLVESKEIPGYAVGHADEVETSLMLYLKPELVDMRKAVDELPEREPFEVVPLKRPTESGVFGKPTLASKEKGERIFNRVVEEMAKFIESKRGGSSQAGF